MANAGGGGGGGKFGLFFIAKGVALVPGADLEIADDFEDAAIEKGFCPIPGDIEPTATEIGFGGVAPKIIVGRVFAQGLNCARDEFGVKFLERAFEVGRKIGRVNHALQDVGVADFERVLCKRVWVAGREQGWDGGKVNEWFGDMGARGHFGFLISDC